MLRHLIAVIALFFITVPVYAQELVTSTPVRINVPTSAAPLIEAVASPTLTWTPTPNNVMVQVRDGAGEINVRAEADIESERLGTIRPGEFYPVLARYFRWIQIQYDTSPTGRAWVFDELVDVIGDINSVTDLSEQPMATTDPLIIGATQTSVAITQTPGGILTQTAEARILPAPGMSLPEVSDTSVIIDQTLSENVLPTFTYPPDLIAQVPTQVEVTLTPTEASTGTIPLSVPNQMPPIVPIALLGAGGFLGLLVSSLRR